jgi:hypothetical protein
MNITMQLCRGGADNMTEQILIGLGKAGFVKQAGARFSKKDIRD